ncbi:hypothetical protein ACOMHN_006801 [Nucella lapillus]
MRKSSVVMQQPQSSGSSRGVRSSGGDGRKASALPEPPKLEPTYRMEPEEPFRVSQVRTIIQETLDKHLDGFQFNPKFTSTMTKVLSEELKDRVKQLGYQRYKVVTSVVMGQRKYQRVVITSRCAWDVRRDSYAAYTFQNKSLSCTASVYIVYRE